ncbi:MAG: ECF transporter S component [Mobilitalea sp.]
METIRRNKTLKMVQLALFIAIIVLMAFTPIGYIKTPGLEITLIVVPVTVGAILLGPAAGAILGGVFGITSFIQCFGMSPFGAALLAINPIGTFILCLIPRILMGWLSGVCFAALKKIDKTKSISYAVANLVGPLLNTVLFMTTLVLIFYSSDYIQGMVNSLNATNPFAFAVGFVAVNGLIEMVICFVLGTAVSKTVDVVVERTSAKQ